MSTFTLDPMPTTTAGQGSISGLAHAVREHGSRAFLVSDPGLQAAGVLDTATQVLDSESVEWTSFIEVDPNPTDVNVAAGVQALREFGVDGTVAVLVGGGSVMDCGKYTAMAAPSDIDDITLAFSPELDKRTTIPEGTTMDLSHYLSSAELLSCNGSVTHRLTLLPDGNVEIEIGNVNALVNPTTRTVLRPRGYSVPEQVMDHAATLARTAVN